MERFAKAYEILGLKPNARLPEVKRAYRKKALLLHPDVNPSPKAAEEFLLIKKAYEIIIEADKHADFWRKESQRQERKTTHDRDNRPPREEAIRLAKERLKRFEQMKLRKEAMQFARFKNSIYYPWTMAMTYVSAIMFCLIFLDAFWVAKTDYGYITKKEAVFSSFGGDKEISAYRLQYGDDKVLEVDANVGSTISEGTHISFAETMIFRDVRYIYKVDENFTEVKIDTSNKPPHLFFLMFLGVPIFILFVDRPSAVFYSAGAFARYAAIFFVLGYLIF